MTTINLRKLPPPTPGAPRGEQDEQGVYHNTKTPPHGFFVLGFPSQTFLEYERSVTWYWWAGGIGLILCAFAFFTNDYLFLLFILIAIFYFLMTAHHDPHVFVVDIYDKGIMVHERWHPMSDYEDFSIIPLGEEVFELSFTPKKRLHLPLDFYVHLNHIEPVREALQPHLQERQRSESFIHLLGRALRF
ncbi:MAG: hypothetical protein KGI50_01430 [Patescibacteria group bacterium]|nr:hypothetical protein [Patescibacteria group bacterium]MDE2437991.1 hypothetical protein [Patescibacteria group bacterium]